MSYSPLQDWEDARAVREIEGDIEALDALPVIDEPPVSPVVVTDAVTSVVCLASRLTAGLGVQLLAEPVEGGRAFITLAINGETETYEIPASRALDAFEHPYCYGGTITPR